MIRQLDRRTRKCHPERRRIADPDSHERWAAAEGSLVALGPGQPKHDYPGGSSVDGEVRCYRGYRSFGRRQAVWQTRFTCSGDAQDDIFQRPADSGGDWMHGIACLQTDFVEEPCLKPAHDQS